MLLLHFWATWCPSCAEDIDNLQRAAAACPEAPLRVIAVNVGEADSDVAEFVNEHGVRLPVLRDPKGRVWREIDGRGLPMNLFWTQQSRRTDVGPKTAELVEAILRERTHPEQGYRSCLGILRLARRYSVERLEAACTRAVAVRARSYRHVASMLKHGLDRLPLPASAASASPQQLALAHENVRGGDYYHSEEGDPPHAH